MAKTSVIPNKLLPYRAGIMIVVPIENGKPNYDKAVATSERFMNTSQVTMSRTTETMEDGNGGRKEFTNAESYTLTVTGNTYSPVVHNTIAGRIERFPAKQLTPDYQNVTLPSTVEDGADLTISFGADGQIKNLPGADSDGKYNFVVEDSLGNTLVRVDGTPEKGSYKYDADTKSLIFSDDYKGETMRVLYWFEDTTAVTYSSNPIIQNPEFLVQIVGMTQDYDTGVVSKTVQTLKRATVSGDLANQPTQVSRSAPITYTFVSAPVDKGVSVYEESLTPYSSGDAAGDESANYPANGVDDAELVKTATKA